jgi:hypothetical protein
MLRRITLALLILVSIGVMLPIASSTAHGIRQVVASRNSGRHYRRHSRAWWKRYRARLRKRRAAAAAALAAHRNSPLPPALPSYAALAARITATPEPTSVDVASQPGWKGQPFGSRGEIRFRKENGPGALAGHAALSVVALSRPTPNYLTAREQRRLLSGVALSDLRRIVIDKMIAAGGWVINDFDREVTGHRVFVVTAQTPADGRSPEKSWNFYFTEVKGRVYSLTTNTPPEFADSMAIEAERFIASLYASGEIASQ